jgi:hypothetical protein
MCCNKHVLQDDMITCAEGVAFTSGAVTMVHSMSYSGQTDRHIR